MDVAADRNPSRALGIAYGAVDPGPKALSVEIDAPALADPRQSQPVSVQVAGAAEGDEVWLTLAAVDVGILNLTGFQAPDPQAYYFGQRRLGMELRDVYGRLIDGMNGALGQVRLRWGCQCRAAPPVAAADPGSDGAIRRPGGRWMPMAGQLSALICLRSTEPCA